jgi:hypothetical protein
MQHRGNHHHYYLYMHHHHLMQSQRANSLFGASVGRSVVSVCRCAPQCSSRAAATPASSATKLTNAQGILLNIALSRPSNNSTVRRFLSSLRRHRSLLQALALPLCIPLAAHTALRCAWLYSHAIAAAVRSPSSSSNICNHLSISQNAASTFVLCDSHRRFLSRHSLQLPRRRFFRALHLQQHSRALAASPRCASEAFRTIAAFALTHQSASPASQHHQHPARSRPSAPSPPSAYHPAFLLCSSSHI